MQPRARRQLAPRHRARQLPGLFALVLAAAGVASGAESGPPQPFAQWQRGAEQPQEGISLDRAVALAEKQYKARVVRASTADADGRRIYVLRLLSDQGRVWTVHVDAQTGAMN